MKFLKTRYPLGIFPKITEPRFDIIRDSKQRLEKKKKRNTKLVCIQGQGRMCVCVSLITLRIEFVDGRPHKNGHAANCLPSCNFCSFFPTPVFVFLVRQHLNELFHIKNAQTIFFFFFSLLSSFEGEKNNKGKITSFQVHFLFYFKRLLLTFGKKLLTTVITG